jgi:hypothetical protein
MIRFVAGFGTIVAAVGAAEGSAGLGTAIMLATVGTIIMLWGIAGMNRENLG